MAGVAGVAGDGFVRVCSVNDLPTVGAVQAEIGPKRVAIVRDSAGDIHAIDDTCSHANVSLSEGDVEEFKGAPTIECALHGSCFDLVTGRPSGPPATVPVPVFPVRILDGVVEVHLPAPAGQGGAA